MNTKEGGAQQDREKKEESNCISVTDLDVRIALAV